MTQSDPLSAGEYRRLPPDAVRILKQLSTPHRLLAHLVLVHDAACTLIERISAEFPEAQLDPDLVRFGAATHDIGKIVHPEELTESGRHQHQRSGVQLLQSLGLPYERARFTWTHGNWNGDDISLDDFIVALADKSWKGKRIEALETRTADFLSAATSRPQWACYAELDEMLQLLARDADKKLAWQASFSA
jgi:putative nucleotidyltransferase with HDIG domain